MNEKETRANWLKSEIEKLAGMEIDQNYSNHWQNGYNQALTSIITRYKEELEVLESK